MTAEPLRIPARDGGSFEAWASAPPSGRGPGLIVLDHRVPPDLYERIRGSLAGKPHAHTYWYEGADHGFNRDGYPPYHPEAAALARRRTLDFLRQHLGSEAT